MEKRTVFFLSDHTGITVEELGRSLLTQFEGLEFNRIRIPYVNSRLKAELTRDRINQVSRGKLQKPIVFSSVSDYALRELILQSDAYVLDFFDAFISPLEKALDMTSSHAEGKTHGLINHERYHSRINAVNYSLTNDDGANSGHYDKADVILIGVSRSGKTPTCLYLALQFGFNTANYPMTEDDLETTELPKGIKPYHAKVIALTISPDQLQRVRQERRPDSIYASLARCQKEVAAAEELYLMQKIPVINTTAVSIEEIATSIVEELGLERREF